MDCCLSGGAIGADLAWGDAARYAGHDVIHFSFARHRSEVPSRQIVRLSDADLRTADPHVAAAGELIQRRLPQNFYTANLLRRNWFQVRDADACYAVSTIKDGLVQGGTGWAVAMFLLRHDLAACPLYVFEQNLCRWFTWTGAGDCWQPLYEPPRPSGRWAGIGSRDLHFIGRLAINTLFDYRPRERRRLAA